MTLNELGFLLFFLLVLLSTRMLQTQKDQIDRKVAQLAETQRELDRQREILDQTFRKLGILEDTIKRLQELEPRIEASELDEHFKRLVDSEHHIRGENRELESRLRAVENLLAASDLVDRGSDSGSMLAAIQELIKSHHLKASEEAQMDKSALPSPGRGLDHRPCWTNPKTGKIEYLYRITIIGDRLRVDSAWPRSRQAESARLPSIDRLAGQLSDIATFRRHASNILGWSRLQRPECRHFVRIADHPSTSKRTFKKQLITIESYFYKYLEND